MTEYSKYNIVYRLQKWIDSVPGQTFLNYAYSWGASIVILGTLFKLTHLPGANIMLFVGMGTEVIVFFISAFDRPFDKTAIGMDLPTHVEEEYDGDGEEDEAEAVGTAQSPAQPAVQGGTIIIGTPGAVTFSRLTPECCIYALASSGLVMANHSPSAISTRYECMPFPSASAEALL